VAEVAAQANEALGKRSTREVTAELLLYILGEPFLGAKLVAARGEELLEVLAHDLVKNRLGGVSLPVDPRRMGGARLHG
jgi:hypothetical protein